MDKCSSRFCHDDMYPGRKVCSAFNEAMTTISTKSFCLNYELLLLIQREKCVVESSLTKDSVTVYGRSCPDITIFRLEGKYVSGTTVVGTSIEATDAKTWEVIGGSIELKRSPNSSKSQQLSRNFANSSKHGQSCRLLNRKGHKIIEEVTTS